ncbi:hypothetical protein C9F11_09000 [Streptomyces sp. YIM 121038]|uniref:hypothetical protein n=1 Tax=Streptomyces sp. YIM 121038 TaxID=2136401 RepID=UPI001110CCDB|nr:hypothetical protein [Streptomyces sp. YIM 121038]QCX75489.1 hypothetical protein C9F11_09000 [Streptomyces sp. YIM 121038]
MVHAVLTEASPLVPSGPEAGGKGIWRARLIEADVQGASGYYPAEVLRRDGPTAFPAGTHVYSDHPTPDEDSERPERSVKDLIGYLVDAARFEESADGRGLFARIQFIPEFRTRLATLAPVIGLSIRAAGEVEEAPSGRRTITSITQGLSADVVTRACAGGRLVTMTESAVKSDPMEELKSIGASVSRNIKSMSIAKKSACAALSEEHKLLKEASAEQRKTLEAISALEERTAAEYEKARKALSLGQIIAQIIQSGLPVSSMVRLAEDYAPGQNLTEAIHMERYHLTTLRREMKGGGVTMRDLQGPRRLSESAHGNGYPSADTIREIDDLLSMKPYGDASGGTSGEMTGPLY